MARKTITEDVKRQVAEAHTRGLSRKKIAEQCGISVSSVSRILKEKGTKKAAPRPEQKAPVKPPEGEDRPVMDQKIAEIERRIDELEKKILYYEAMKKGRGVGPIAELFSRKKSEP